jgi:hypothetical protein
MIGGIDGMKALVRRSVRGLSIQRLISSMVLIDEAFALASKFGELDGGRIEKKSCNF